MIARSLALGTAGVVAVATLTTGTTATSTAALPAPATAARAAERTATPYAPPGALVTNGDLHDVTRVGDRVVARGFFTQVGRYSGPAVALDAATGARTTAPVLDDGMVSVAVPDGAGGWYAGGDFTLADDRRLDDLVHVLADGTVDPDFDVAVTGGGGIYALALAGDVLYLGGSFSSVAGVERHNLAAVDVATGTPTGFRRDTVNPVPELAYGPASGARAARVYVGLGDLVALDATTGARDATFDAEVPRRTKYEIAVAGDRVYVGYNGIAALDADTGAVDPAFVAGGLGEASAAGDRAVSTLLVDGDRLLVGGAFTTLAGAPGPLASYDATTGAPDLSFAPSITGRGRAVHDVALAGDRLWAGGVFDTAGGSPADNLVALDPTTGVRLAGAPRVSDTVNAVDVSGDHVLVGGGFTMLDPLETRNFASLDARTLAPLSAGTAGNPFDPVVTDGRVLYRQGYRSVIASSAVDGHRLPRLTHRVGRVVAVAAGPSRLVVVQGVDQYRDAFRDITVTSYSTRTGKQLRRSTLPVPGYVTDARLLGGGNLVLSGSFKRTRNGNPANLSVLKYVLDKGRLVRTFDPHLDGPVDDIADRGPLMVSGVFGSSTDELGRTRRTHRGIARLDPVDGLAGTQFTGQLPTRNGSGVVWEPIGPLRVGYANYPRPTRFIDPTTGRPAADPTGGWGARATSFEPRRDGGLVYVTLGSGETYRSDAPGLIGFTG